MGWSEIGDMFVFKMDGIQQPVATGVFDVA
jgi:hypothetical protein